MTALDRPLRSVSSNLIRRFGTSIVLKQRAAGVVDTSTDSVAVASTDLPVRAVVSDYESNEFDDLVKSGDKKVLVAAADITGQPTTEWTARIASRWGKIVRVRPVYSGDLVAIYEIAVRGA